MKHNSIDDLRIMDLRKGVAFAMSIALAFSGTTYGITKGMGETEASYAVAADTEKKITEEFSSLSSSDADSDTLTKDETVFVISDADGKDRDVTVDEWLKNPEKIDTIEDMTTIDKIENISGNEKFVRSGDDLTWHASGKDIKYQGKTDNELPVEVNVTYYLDGDKVSSEEIAGKKGDVEIHFDYKVNRTVTLPGAAGAYDMTKPYLMASGLLLDNTHFDDIEVTDGKVVTEGDDSICLGVAMPGLQKDLGIDKSLMNIPEKVVIKATTDDFEIDGTYSVALSGVLGELDLTGSDVSSKVDQVENAFDQLESAAAKLVDGSDTLADGAASLNDGAEELHKGTEDLSNGAKTLDDGASKLYKGTKSLAKGTSALSEGTSKLNEKSSALESGVNKLYDGSKSLASGSKSLKKGTEQAVSGAKQLDDGLTKLSGNSSAIIAGTTQVVDSVFDSTSEQLSTAIGQQITLTRNNYTSVLDGLSGVLPAETVAKLKGTLAQMISYEEGVKSYAGGVDEAAKGSSALVYGLKDLDKGAGKVSKGAQSIKEGLSTMSGSIPELKKGVKALDAGANKVNSGTKELKKGAKKLSDGTGSLSVGAGKLNSGAGTLATGADRLADGADQLADGMFKFNRDGIQKLVNSLDTAKIKDIAGRFDVLKADSEKSYYVGGSLPGTEGETRIVFKTGEIKSK